MNCECKKVMKKRLCDLVLIHICKLDIAELDGGKVCEIIFPDPNKLDKFEANVSAFKFLAVLLWMMSSPSLDCSGYWLLERSEVSLHIPDP